MVRRDGCAPGWIVFQRADFLLGMHADPMAGQVKCAVYEVRHMTADTATDAIDGTQAGVLRDAGAMAACAGLFAAGHNHGTGSILMRIVTVGAGDFSAALTPALAVLQGRYLIGNQQVVGHRVFDETGAGVTLRAGPHALGRGQFVRVQYAQVL